MKNGLPKEFDVGQAAIALNDNDHYALEAAFTWAGSPQGEAFWEREFESMEDGEDMSDAAKTAIKNWIAQSLGFTPAGVAAANVVAGLTDADAGGVATVQAVEAQAAPFPARAIAFGQPQYMGGMGAWDNARYFEPESE